jgi:hypothetical protein
MEDNFLGKLIRSDFISTVNLDNISTYDLGCELLKRLQDESNNEMNFHFWIMLIYFRV